MNNIILIGMPASGKSTVGVLLAKTLGMDFIDTDLLIQKKKGALLQNIIINEGIDSFVKIEEDIILNLQATNVVIATGGSAVYSERSMNHLKETGSVIYLRVDYDEIQRRLTNITTRGIVFDKGQSLKSLYEERLPLYQGYADIVIDCNDKDVEGVISIIKKSIQKQG